MTLATKDLAIPTTPEQITPRWLTRALRVDDEDELLIDELVIEPVGLGVGIMSVLFRVTPIYARGSGPESVVVKLAAPYEQVREVAAGYGFYGREVAIYQTLGDEVGLRPPTVFHAAHDPATDDFVLVMEDLGGLRCCDQLTGCSVDDAEVVVTELARHHARWWGDPRLDSLPFIQSWAEPPYPLYHEQSTAQAWPVAVERFGDVIPERIRRLGDRWSEIGPVIMEDIPNHPATLCHGDVRLDNVFFHGDGGVSIVDWQIAGSAAGVGDVAYFLSQSLTVGDRRSAERDLLERYHETLLANGVAGYGFAELWRDYRQAVLFDLCYPMTAGAVELVNDRAYALARTLFERSIAAIVDLDADELAPSA